MEQYPLLEEGFEDLELLQAYHEPIQKLCRILFPDVLATNEIKVVTLPIFFIPLYKSSRFEKILQGSNVDFVQHLLKIEKETLYMYICFAILGSYYGYSAKAGPPMLMEVENKLSGTKNIFKMPLMPI